YEDMLELTESLVSHVDRALRAGVAQSAPQFWSERPFTFDEPFARVDMREAILRRCDASARPASLVRTPLDGTITRAIIDDETAVATLVASAFEAGALKGADFAKDVRQRWFDAAKHLAKPMGYGERLFVL